MFREIGSLDELIQLQEKETAMLAYFSTEVCNVCKVLKPKVGDLVSNHFPEICLVYVRTDLLPDVSARHQVFAVPTILVFFEGREYIRKSRNIGIAELHQEINRPYSMIFS